MKKAADKVKNPAFSVSKAVTIDGNANIEITENKEKEKKKVTINTVGGVGNKTSRGGRIRLKAQ